MSEFDRPVFDVIKDAMVDGRLPRDFSLPVKDDMDGLRFADGALDGCCFYHMGKPDVEPQTVGKLREVLSAASQGDTDEAVQKLRILARDIRALEVIDEFENVIIENADSYDLGNVLTFVLELLFSNDTELVKFGMEITEVMNEPNEELKQVIRTLALSDEFTLFALFNMANWSNSASEIFDVAQKTYGWGRIHAIERLLPENDEMRDWLLAEGIDNAVMEEYSALEVYQKAEVYDRLSGKLSAEELGYITRIISAMFREGPVFGISAVSEKDEMLMRYLAQVRDAEPTADICNTVMEITDSGNEDIHHAADSYLRTERVSVLVAELLKGGKGISLAEYLDIPYREVIYRNMCEDFDQGYMNCSALMKDDDYRERVTELFMQRLPLSEMADRGAISVRNPVMLHVQHPEYIMLLHIVQALEEYPMCGVELVMAALDSPAVICRNAALNVIGAWCGKRGCALSELSQALYDAVIARHNIESDEDIIRRLEAVL